MAVPQQSSSRGVYLLPDRGPAGERTLIAVTHQGTRLVEATILPGVKVEALERLLWTILDTEDPPPPRLRLL